jgi:hypothetical protein
VPGHGQEQRAVVLLDAGVGRTDLAGEQLTDRAGGDPQHGLGLGPQLLVHLAEVQVDRADHMLSGPDRAAGHGDHPPAQQWLGHRYRHRVDPGRPGPGRVGGVDEVARDRLAQRPRHVAARHHDPAPAVAVLGEGRPPPARVAPRAAATTTSIAASPTTPPSTRAAT